MTVGLFVGKQYYRLIVQRPPAEFSAGGLFPSSHSFVTMGMIMGLRFVCLYR